MVIGLFLAMSAVLLTAGCLSFTGGRRRIFSYRPPEQKATVELSDNNNNDNNDTAGGQQIDSNVKFTQAKVNDSLERLMRALNNSKMKKEPTSPISQSQPETEIVETDPDSLAAKLSESPSQKPTVSYKSPKQDSQPRPIITPIRKKSSFASKAKAPVQKTVKSTPQIKIVKIEPVVIPERKPVQRAKPKLLPSTSLKKINIQPKQITHQANESVKIDLPALQSDPNSALKQLVSQLEKKIKSNPNDTATMVKVRLIQALLGQYQLAMKDDAAAGQLKGQQLANDLARLVKIFSDEKISQAQQINQAANIVERMSERLSEIADLKISNLKLCREVQSFGAYKLMPDSYFVIGKRLPVIVYTELEHFVSKYSTKDKVYITELALTIEIIDPKSGTVCWRHHDEYIKDVSQNRRQYVFIFTACAS